MDARTAPVGANGILQRLSDKTLALIAPHLRKVTLAQCTILHEAGEAITTVYFPLSGMVSMLASQRLGKIVLRMLRRGTRRARRRDAAGVAATSRRLHQFRHPPACRHR
jgi:CRP-like cAMP-binding protein